MSVPFVRSWLAQRLHDWKQRRVFEQERLSVAFLNAVAQAMEDTGTSKADLAERLGCSRANVTQLLRGSRNLTAHTMADLAGALGRRVAVELEPLEAVDYQPMSVSIRSRRTSRVIYVGQLQVEAPRAYSSASASADLAMAS